MDNPPVLSPQEKKTLIGLLKKVRLLELINILEDHVWRVRMNGYLKNEIMREHNHHHEKAIK
jgi:hypothetical protein